MASAKTYVATKAVKFLYPAAGDPKPPGGSKVLLLTLGGICVTGTWDPRFCRGWHPLIGRDMEKEAEIERQNSPGADAARPGAGSKT
jgi:hypothetical protein